MEGRKTARLIVIKIKRIKIFNLFSGFNLQAQQYTIVLVYLIFFENIKLFVS